MDEDVHEELVDGKRDASAGLQRHQDELSAQQRNQDDGGADRLHVDVSLGAVSDPQFGDQHPHDVQQEEQVHLSDGDRLQIDDWCRGKRNALLFQITITTLLLMY